MAPSGTSAWAFFAAASVTEEKKSCISLTPERWRTWWRPESRGCSPTSAQCTGWCPLWQIEIKKYLSRYSQHLTTSRDGAVRFYIFCGPTRCQFHQYYISSFFVQMFFYTAFSSQFGFVIFWWKDFGAKATHKMLVKLTPGRISTSYENASSANWHCWGKCFILDLEKEWNLRIYFISLQRFYSMLEKKTFCTECSRMFSLKLFHQKYAMEMSIKDGSRLGSWSVVQWTLFNKDIHLQLNSFIMPFHLQQGTPLKRFLL